MPLKDLAALISGDSRLVATRKFANATDSEDGIIDGVTDSDKEHWEGQGAASITGTANAILVDLVNVLTGVDAASDVTIGPVLKIDQTNDRVGINKLAPAVDLDVVGETIFKGDVTVQEVVGGTTVFKVDENVPVVGVGGDPNIANALLQLIGGGLDLENAQAIQWENAAGAAFDGSLVYDADDNLIFDNAATGGAGSRDTAGFRVMVDSLGTAPGLIVDDQGNVGMGTPAPVGADSGVGARLHIVGGAGNLLIEDGSPEVHLKVGVGDDWKMRVKTSDLYFTYAGADAMRITIGGLYGETESASRLWGKNSDGDVFTALTFNTVTELRGYKTQVAPNANGSIKLLTKLDGPAGAYPNTTYGPLFVEGYSGNVGLWLNSLPTEALQMGDAGLTEQMGIKVFDGGANQMAFLDLMEQNNSMFVYQDTNGVMRIHTAKPGATGDAIGATRVISQTVVNHGDPHLAAGARPSDVEGCIVIQYASSPGTTRLYGRSPSGVWAYTSISAGGAAQESISWSLSSLAGTSGTYYFGGFYNHASGGDDFTVPPTHGTANGSYAAHAYIVLGLVAVDEITVRVSGTSIDDNGVRVGVDSEDIIIPNTTAADSYFETSKKWLGQITFTHIAGTAKVCNYGFCKYYDHRNQSFTVVGLEALWLAGATDVNVGIDLIHHKSTGWTYVGGGTATPPSSMASLDTDHGADDSVISGEEGAWKRANLGTMVNGAGSEGTIVRVTTTANNAIESGTFRLEIEH